MTHSTWNVCNAESKVLDLIIPDMEPFPGAVAIAQLHAPGWGATTKYRPVILQGIHDSKWWRCWKMTSQEHYSGGRGQRRHRVHGLDGCGLSTDSYLWTPTLHDVEASAVIGVVWACPPEVLATLGWLTGGLLPRWAEQASEEVEESGWYWPRPLDIG